MMVSLSLFLFNKVLLAYSNGVTDFFSLTLSAWLIINVHSFLILSPLLTSAPKHMTQNSKPIAKLGLFDQFHQSTGLSKGQKDRNCWLCSGEGGRVG